MTEEEYQAKILELEDELNKTKAERDAGNTTIAEQKATIDILKDNNQKLFSRVPFGQPENKSEEPPKPQGIEAIKEFLKRGK